MKREGVEREPLLGAHMSIAGGTYRAVERAREAGCNVLQIFVKNSNRWQGKDLIDSEVERFRRERRKAGLKDVVAHNSYLINLAASAPSLWERSVEAMLDELARSQRLGLSLLVTHPGSHVGAGISTGVSRIAAALNRIHERTEGFDVRPALETTAGQGTSIGHRFEELRDILGACRRPERVAVCFDTCHVFAAGYDIRSREGYEETMEAFERTLGLSCLRLFHFNDSKKDLGSRVDRHEHIGKGFLGEQAFAHILNDPRFDAIPKILETPKGEDLKEDRENLRVLRSLVRRRTGCGGTR